MKQDFDISKHIKDHAELIIDNLVEFDPEVHKHHFKSSIDTAQLIAQGFDTPEKIDAVMKKILDEAIETEYEFKVKTRSYTNKKGEKKDYYSTKRFSLAKDTLAAYHNRGFDNEKPFQNIEGHFHFLFSDKQMGLSYFHLKKHLSAIAEKYNLVFHFDEAKENKTNEGQMKKASKFSWFLQKMTNKKFKEYVKNNQDDLSKNLDVLYDYAASSENLQFFVKVMNRLRDRLQEQGLNFSYKSDDISKEYAIPLSENQAKELQIFATAKSKNDIQMYIKRDSFLARDYVKFLHSFQSTVFDELVKKGYHFKKFKDIDLTEMKSVSKHSEAGRKKRKTKFKTFNQGVEQDVKEVLKYAYNEKSFKQILESMGYENISFRNKNVNGKREKIGLKFVYNDKDYTVYFNQINLSQKQILQAMMTNAKDEKAKLVVENLKLSSQIANIKFFNSYQNKIFKSIYTAADDIDLSQYYIKQGENRVELKSKELEIMDEKDLMKLVSGEKLTDEEAKLIAKMLVAKKWDDAERLRFSDMNETKQKQIKTAITHEKEELHEQ
jgi:hypothetical protein